MALQKKFDPYEINITLDWPSPDVGIRFLENFTLC